MKVSFLPENIIKYLPLINKALPSHSQVPILSNILLKASKDGLFLEATDLDIGVVIKIPSKIEEQGSITIPGKEFLETINSLPREKILIEKDKDTLVLTCHDNRVIFNTISGEEFPQLLKEKGEIVSRMKRDQFVSVFSNITFSVSMEESRPQLTGIFMDVVDDGVNFVSTDGYRMTMKKVKEKEIKRKEGLIVSVKLINEVISLKGEEDVSLFVNEKESQVVFEVGEVLVVGRMIGGAFPDYLNVLPKSPSTTVVFDREGLLQNVRLASVFAKDNSNIATLKIKNGTISVETKTQGVGSGETSIECDQKGEDVQITFNIRYLSDVLKAAGGKTIKMGLNSSSEPALFEDKDFLHVIMPIQVDG